MVTWWACSRQNKTETLAEGKKKNRVGRTEDDGRICGGNVKRKKKEEKRQRKGNRKVKKRKDKGKEKNKEQQQNSHCTTLLFSLP